MHRLIDTHAHLDELQNLDSMLEAARTAGVIAIVAVGSNRQSNMETGLPVRLDPAAQEGAVNAVYAVEQRARRGPAGPAQHSHR